MDWDFLWLLIGRASNVLGVLSVVISFALWLSFGNLKREIEREKVKYIEEQDAILKNLNFLYKTLFTDNVKTDDVISAIRKQIFSISKCFRKLMIREDRKCIRNLMKILDKDADKMDFAGLRKNLDFIITAFTQRSYGY